MASSQNCETIRGINALTLVLSVRASVCNERDVH